METHRQANITAKVPSRRQRTNGRACIACHQRKVRCDVLELGSPCTNCRTQKRPDCRLYEKKRFRDTAKTRDHVPIQPRTPVSSAASTVVPSNSIAASVADDREDEEQEQGNLADFMDCEDWRVAPIGPAGRSCFIGTGMSNFNYLVRQSSLNPGSDNILHLAIQQLPRKYTSSGLQHVPSEAMERVDRPLELRLIRAYFDYVNVGWPIVDEEMFMAQYENRELEKPLPFPLLNAILMVGCHVLAPEDKSLRKIQPIFFRRAKILMDCRYEQDRKMYIQVALLFTWYSDGLEEIVANCWHWVGVATRTALGCGMHRDVTRSPMHAAAKRDYTRLWWVLFQFDTTASAAYGRPQALNLDESDVPELEPSHFEGIPNAQWEFVVHHSKLCAIISKAMRKRWSLRAMPEDQIKAIREADEELGRFSLDLPDSLQLSLPDLTTWQSTLHITYNNFIIILHRPPPRNKTKDETISAYSDSNMCGGATIHITSILETLLHKGKLSTLWTYDVHAVFTALIQVCSELNSPSPLVSAKARRTCESLLKSLRVFSEQSLFAKGVLHLFKRRSDRSMAPRSNQNRWSSASDALHNSNVFALRPGTAEAVNPAASTGAGFWTPQSSGIQNGQGPVYMESNGPVTRSARSQGLMQQNMSEVDVGAVDDSLMSMQPDYDPDLFGEQTFFQDVSVLELFLAGLDKNT